MVNLRGGSLAAVEGWYSRHQGCARIAEQLELARSGGQFVVLFRGQDRIEHREDLFIIGQKARPLYHGGDKAKLERTLRRLATNEESFGRLAGAFAETPLGKRANVSGVDLLRRFQNAADEDRVLLAQLLTEGLQYQNCKPPAANWRDYLFLLSATTEADRAAMYALNGSLRGSLNETFILEYAPPTERNLFRSVKDFRREYAAMGLGEAFRDW